MTIISYPSLGVVIATLKHSALNPFQLSASQLHPPPSFRPGDSHRHMGQLNGIKPDPKINENSHVACCSFAKMALFAAKDPVLTRGHHRGFSAHCINKKKIKKHLPSLFVGLRGAARPPMTHDPRSTFRWAISGSCFFKSMDEPSHTRELIRTESPASSNLLVSEFVFASSQSSSEVGDRFDVSLYGARRRGF